MASIKIISDKCVGCRLCVGACPFGAIEMNDDRKAVILDNCTLCGICVSSCKFDAIDFQKEEVSNAVDTSLYKGVWIFAEQKKDEPESIVYELLGVGRTLADDRNITLTAVILGKSLDNAGKKLISQGADKVLLVEDESLAHYNDESYTDIFVQLIEQNKPEIILMG
ncbi:MAG: 4Fe-4S binding protein, partial [Clostridiales bacterium]|nr:4Fe-4S binding protein [Clostridiales bacterium]